ncbi:hypothetical protein ACJ6WF_06185 [Streptomyces sp. MMS24-I2-30]|uniref:hypothetical protein n=1 Tax=Streptomyces sp. MMS24-I2-30 TaxID=3351564 RepID=UPI00389696EB
MITNPELAAARSSVPAIDEAERRLKAARTLLADASHTVGPDEARHAVLEEAAEAFIADGSWPKDVGKRAAKAFDDAQAIALDRQARQRAVMRAEWGVYNALDDHTEDALAFLGARLAELLTAARSAFETVGGARSAEDVIDAGPDAVAAWSRLRELTRDVGNVRTAEWDLLRGPKVPGSPVGGDWRGRTWRIQGFGHVKDTHPDEAPDDVRKVMRDVSGRVTLEYLRWLAFHDGAYVPASEDALESDVLCLTTPVAYDDADHPVRDFSPVELPARGYRPSKIFEHSTTPNLDGREDLPAKPVPNATVDDPKPFTPTYF